ncbi:hypothetical protein SprV_0301205500 [Sparganum proliferum]
MVSTAPTAIACLPKNPHRTPAHPNQHPLPLPDAREGHLDVPSVVTLTPAGLCPRLEAGPAGRAGNKGDRWTGHRLVVSEIQIRLQPRRRRPREATPSNGLTQRLVNLPVATAAAATAADENASTENQWCHLRDSPVDDAGCPRSRTSPTLGLIR